jgi:predicted Zn-dependent protease with MMP-like domain
MGSNRSALGAAGISVFVVAMVLWFINPPSLNGAEGLVSLLFGAVALTLLMGWATVALQGEVIPEEEFERIVLRTEELARNPQMAHDATEFDLIVADAIDAMPAEFQELLETTPVVVSQHGAESRAYGHYFGDRVSGGRYESRIVIYQDTLERDFGHDPELLRAQVERTLYHEVAHHLGWGERGVRGLGL